MAKPSLFISYARADAEPFVKRLYEALTKDDYSVWWDRVSMPSRDLTFLQDARDAITDVDRVLLVISPAIGNAKYARAEWEYALSICKGVIPLLWLGDYDLLPDALKNVNAIDCRESRSFETAFEEIKRLIDEPSGELGTLHAVPLRPQWYIRREEDLQDVINLVCADTMGPVVVTSKKQTVTLQGTSGIGKTTLAAALAHDCEVRRNFPDGVFWLVIGKEPTITLRQGDIGVTFNDTRDNYPDVEGGKSRSGEILADKRGLLILDDVWQREHAEAFRVNAPRCRLLITTRQTSLATLIGTVQHEFDTLTEDEGVTLIETRLGIISNANPYRNIHLDMVRLLDGYTLAVSITAAQLALNGVDFVPRLFERLQKRQGEDNPFKDLKIETGDRQYDLEYALSLN